MVSIIIAAYNEEDVLGRTLDALLAGAPEAQIIVVANGCRDATAEVARSRPGVTVVELEQGNKPNALNAGEELATSFPRIYLDADIVVPAGGVAEVVAALERPGTLAAVPARELNLEGRPWPVRAWASVHARLPVFHDSLFGRGMVALSQEGRARFDRFPGMIADDLFLDSLFGSHEKAEVDTVSVVVETPAHAAELLSRLVRVRRGSAAMREAARSGELATTVRPADRWSWLRDVVAKDLRLIPAGVVYAAITLTAGALARRQPRRAMDWGGRARPSEGGTRVGFLGVQADTANLGLAALAYSATRLLDEACPGPGEFVYFSVNTQDSLELMRAELGIADKRLRAVAFRHKRPLRMLAAVREIAACDVVIDFTGGDSFSDIYGTRRLLRKLLHKQFVLATRTPLVLAPQTYGPLTGRAVRPWYRHVLDAAAAVYTRDDLSVGFLRTLTPRPVHIATDVAVALPFTPVQPRPPGSRTVRIGLNVSGLLWEGGYTGDNQFGLAADYRDYCSRVAGRLLDLGHEVHLVPHVLTRGWEPGLEDDVAACRALLRLQPRCVLAPEFAGPIMAKSWIAGLDAFVGSRMHATIASFTSGVPTVPAAYSRKFAGFFGGLGYPVVVDLTQLPTGQAVDATLAHLADLPGLRRQADPALGRARRRVEFFRDAMAELIAGG